MKKLTLIFILAIGSTAIVNAQEVVKNLRSNSALHKGPVASHTGARATGDTLQLPFRDDFSNKSIYPDPTKWLNNYVFINNTYPTNKISYGVATFDGLNQYGIAYAFADSGLSSTVNYGADTLTSRFIDLHSFQDADNLVFSFSYEPKGVADYPDPGDSLVLEFSIDDTTWNTVWAIDGYLNDIANPTFTDVSVPFSGLLNENTFFRSSFQFRFRNNATITGINDQWHLDYVYLNSNRTDFGTYVDHFTAAGGCDSARTVVLSIVPSISDTVYQVICPNASYAGHNQPGTYIDHFTSAGGCDSMRTLFLDTSSQIFTTVTQNICSGSSYGGHNVAGVYTDTLHAIGGCDSIRTLYLSTDGNIADTVYANICAGGSYDGHSPTGAYKNDLTFLDAPEYFLKTYTSMPWGHFYNYQGSELGDSIHFCVVNHFNSTISPTINIDVKEKYSNTVLPSLPYGGGFSLNSADSRCFSRPVNSFAPIVFTPTDTDSVVISVRTYVDQQTNDFYPDNDTVYRDVAFSDYFAYDDGSCEKAYGLDGTSGLFQFAYEYHLNHPDTLRAILIHFTTILTNTDNDLFSVYVWKHIDKADVGASDSVMYHEDFRKPLFVDTMNGFAIFTIKSSPPLVTSDTFYVGYQQVGNYNIDVGYDVNTDARAHMYYNTSGVWLSSSSDSTLIPGAPMIRPVVGNDKHLIDTYVNEVATDDMDWRVYPNPVTNRLLTTYKTTRDDIYSEIYDLTGRLVSKQAYHNNLIDVNSLQPGFYLLKFSSAGEPVKQVARFVKM